MSEDWHEKIHKAEPGETEPYYCRVCGQRIKQVPGGQGATWVHSDSGAVVARNPPPIWCRTGLHKIGTDPTCQHCTRP